MFPVIQQGVSTVLQLLLIALSLALDAMAVSISVGMADPTAAFRQGLRMGVWFGGFQFAMPLLGFLLGRTVSAYIESAAPFIAFALLAFIGGRMVWDSLQSAGCDLPESPGGALTNRRLFSLAVATSIDALAVGVSAAFMAFPLLLSCAVIGVTAFVLSLLGAVVGRKLGCAFQRWAQVFGGAVLILIGLKFLLERLFAA